ncbi:MAG TPA: RNA polymerase sigma factor [Burkholderiaceae bacterium]|nr:RNA polymerase sigma factor [Burkholderiaceae bacterium]
MAATRERRLAEAVAEERGRLLRFIRRRVADAGDAEDILQDVLAEFVEAYRLPVPIERLGAWLFRVARNRIIDRFRKQRPQPLSSLPGIAGDDADAETVLDDLLPATERAGPEAQYARRVLVEALEAALEELPPAQRDVFIAHELDGRSFKDMAAESGLSINTLLARKRYAVLHLRERLQGLYDEFDAR